MVACVSFRRSLAIGHECSFLIVGAEPEHQRVILIVGTTETIGLQAYALCAVQCYRYTIRTLPYVVGQFQVVGTRCMVVAVAARAFVHRIVVQQTVLITCQRLLGIFTQFGSRKAAVPQAELQHLTLIVAKRIVATATYP